MTNNLNSYKLLENNWDGKGGVKPNNSIIQTTKNFIKILENNNIAEPKLMLSGDNEIALFWNNKSNYIEISITNSKNFSYFCKFSKGIYGEDKVDIKSIPEKLMQVLENFRMED